MALLLEPGREAIPEYPLRVRLGRGGFGEVWRAGSPNGDIALKFVPLASRAAEVEQRALKLFEALRHDNLIRVFRSWQIDDYLVVAMELADGTLLDRFDRARAAGQPGIPPAELLDALTHAAAGLDYLHASHNLLPASPDHAPCLQHRDVKPENLLLVGGVVKLGDWGLVRVLQDAVASHTGMMTPRYAAPEFFQGKTTDKSDQYSLALTYHYLRTGRHVFDGDLADAHLNRPPDLSALPPGERLALARALAKNPWDRYASCRVLVEELGQRLREGPTFLPSPTPPPPSPTPPVGLKMPSFNLGSVVLPENFIDREPELARGQRLIEAGQSFLLVGRHRVGKTSFCHKLIHQVLGSPSNSILAVYINLQSCVPLTNETFLEHTLIGAVGEIARQVFRVKYTDLHRPDPASANPLLRGDRTFEEFVQVGRMIHERTLQRGGIEPAPLRFPEFVQFAHDLLHIGRLRGLSNYAIFYDEANRLPRDLSVGLLVSNEEALNQAGVLSVYVCSPEMVEAFGPLRETFGNELRLGPFPSIRDLQRLLAHYCFNDPRRVADIPVSVEALEQLWNLTVGQPYLIQMLAGQSFDLACAEGASAVQTDHISRALTALKTDMKLSFPGDAAGGG